MPSFQPPLSHTSNVLSTSASPNDDTYLSLDFFLDFEPEEDQSGQWEIWTDIPSLVGADGNPNEAMGGWHAIRFHSVNQNSSSETESEQTDSPSSIKLSAPSEINAQAIHTLRANAIIAPDTDATYSYTYRHVFPDGNIHWLGGEGSNGVIQLVKNMEEPGNIVAAMEEDVKISQPGFGLLLNAERSVNTQCIKTTLNK